MSDNSHDWNSLIFGSYNHDEIGYAVRNTPWQGFREDLRERPHDEKFTRLRSYIANASNDTEAELRRIRVTNYVNALKRGGLIE